MSRWFNQSLNESKEFNVPELGNTITSVNAMNLKVGDAFDGDYITEVTKGAGGVNIKTANGISRTFSSSTEVLVRQGALKSDYLDNPYT